MHRYRCWAGEVVEGVGVVDHVFEVVDCCVGVGWLCAFVLVDLDDDVAEGCGREVDFLMGGDFSEGAEMGV